MPEKTLALNSCVFLVKHIVAKTIEQLQQHLKKLMAPLINSGFPEPSPACVPPPPHPPLEQKQEQEPITRRELFMQRRFHRPVYF